MYFSTEDGGYFSFSPVQESKYMGLFFARKNTLLKTIEDIRFSSPRYLLSESSARNWSERIFSDNTQERFYWKNGVFGYEKNTDDEIEIIFDIKQSYDNREFGRYYTILQKDQKNICVRFHKKNDLREPEGEEYEAQVYLFAEEGFDFEEKWISKTYIYDARREGVSSERYVFAALRTRARRFCISDKPITKAFVAQEHNPQSLSRTAAQCAQDSLLALCSDMHGRNGLLAGHPWFFQYWTRDEAISAKGLWLAGKKKLAKEILLNALEHIDSDGRIPNRIPEADIGCADGVGWTFFRLKELYEKESFSKREVNFVQERLSESLSRIEKNLMKNGLVHNARLETWMDTDFSGDERAGARIEIQTLTHQMYIFLHLLTRQNVHRKKAEAFQKRVREVFWNGEFIQDGHEDSLIRPNIFLSYYLSPTLFSLSHWKKSFDLALQKLWLPWGGFSTLPTDHNLFCPQHSGQNNKSYHRGDSWYFLNNIAAICFLRMNKKYVQYAKKIISASQKDILDLGAKGCASEISSAEHQTSEGCFNQAWSNATFLELMEETSKS
jgi:glycogen debranching enzyme